MINFRKLANAGVAVGLVAILGAAPALAQIAAPTTPSSQPGLFVDFGGGYASMGSADWSAPVALGQTRAASRFEARAEGGTFHGLVGYGFGKSSLPLWGSNHRFIVEGSYLSGDQSQSASRDASQISVAYFSVGGDLATFSTFNGASNLIEKQTTESRLRDIALRLEGDHPLGGGATVTASLGLVLGRKEQEFSYSAEQTGASIKYQLNEALDVEQIGPEISVGYSAQIGSALSVNFTGRLAWLASDTDLTAADTCPQCSFFVTVASKMAAQDSQSNGRAKVIAGIAWMPAEAWSLSLSGFGQYDSDVATVVHPLALPTAPAFIDYSSEWSYGVNGVIAYRF